MLIRQSVKHDANTRRRVVRIVHIVNKAYSWSESEQWIINKKRTNVEEIRKFLSEKSLFVAFSDSTLIGVVQFEQLDNNVASFGMLAVDSLWLGQGVGTALIATAENWAKNKKYKQMEIQIVRAINPNKHKIFLHNWYSRLGYIELLTYPIVMRIPEIAQYQRQKCVSTVYRKSLK